MHTVFSIDDTSYQRWQARLLAFSHRRAGQRGPLTCLASTDTPGQSALPGTFYTPPHSPHPVTGDHYTPFNKPFAVTQWLAAAPPDEETVVLVDPDCVFLRPIEVTAERGRPLGQPIGYMDKATVPAVIERLCRHPEQLAPVGIPIAIHRDDLAAIAPSWLALTEAIRGDRELREQAGWVAEMWAYCIAAANGGLRHELLPMARFQTEDGDDLPMVHYCYHSEDRARTWRWSKRDYAPWEPVEEPPSGTPAASVALIRLLNEYVDYRAGGGEAGG